MNRPVDKTGDHAPSYGRGRRERVQRTGNIHRVDELECDMSVTQGYKSGKVADVSQNKGFLNFDHDQLSHVIAPSSEALSRPLSIGPPGREKAFEESMATNWT